MTDKANGGEATAAGNDGGGGSDPLGGSILPGNDPADATPEGAEQNATTETAEPAEGTEPEAGAEDSAAPDEGAEPENPEPEKGTDQPAKKWAGKFESPEALEVAYQHSSKEGLRLHKENQSIRAEAAQKVEELTQRIADLQIQIEAGPEIKEPSDEELAAMPPGKAAKVLQQISDRKRALADLKQKQEAAKARAQQDSEKLRQHILATSKHMASDKENFPDYAQLAEEHFDDLLDLEPGIAGLPETPKILYWAAVGRQALASRSKAKQVESSAKKKAADAARAAATKAGATGASSAGAPGAGKPKPKAAAGDEGQSMVDAFHRKLEPIF